MAKIKSVQVADPGVAFILEFDPGDIPTGARLTDLGITATVTDNSIASTPSFSVTARFSNASNPITDNSLVLILPFGDSTWAPGHNMSVSVTLNSTSVPSLNGVLIPVVSAISQSGSFTYSVSTPQAPAGFFGVLRRLFGLE
jgi:hypothetical protein